MTAAHRRSNDSSGAPPRRLAEIVTEAATCIPEQAPLGAFVHHNPLHSFEDRPFHTAVSHVHDLIGAEPYPTLGFFHEQWRDGRIRPCDIEAALTKYPDAIAPMPAGLELGAIRRILLFHETVAMDLPALKWAVREEGLLDRYPEQSAPTLVSEVLTRSERWLRARLRGEGLRHAIDGLTVVEAPWELEDHLGLRLDAVHIDRRLEDSPAPIILRLLFAEAFRIARDLPRTRTSASPRPLSLRGRVFASTGVDIHAEVRPKLIRWSASYLDAGMASWSMPGRDAGFYRSVRDLSSHSGQSSPWMLRAREHFERQERENHDSIDVVDEHLEWLGTTEDTRETVIREALHSLPGWAGMMSRLEKHPEDRPPDLSCSLLDFLAVLFTLERSVLEVRWPRSNRANEPFSAWLQSLPEPPQYGDDCLGAAHTLFRLFRDAGVDLATAHGFSTIDGQRLLDASRRFDDIERRRVFQEAYEKHYRDEVLDAMAANARAQRAIAPETPNLQVLCCIDDREESLRRHLEELSPRVQTFGAAGFYGLAILYRGLKDWGGRALCPASVEADHSVREVPIDSNAGARWTARHRIMVRAGHARHAWGRTSIRGLVHSMLGVAEAMPMVARIASPELAHRIQTGFLGRVTRPPRTRLTTFARSSDKAKADPDLPLGYRPDEAAPIVAGILGAMGLVREFAPLVIVLGHGSTSSNNPHEAAYQCGACAGGNGGPNARLFADLANSTEVRRLLRERGVRIPEGTHFVGGLHDTSMDKVEFYDIDRVPDSHRERLNAARELFDEARARNAHERCRRFSAAALDISPTRALRHVEGRSLDLAQPLPEYNHCTNSLCVVGRRWSTRGLFLDRRAFLVSYDPKADSEGKLLEDLLASVLPVCAGINLEYYFSTIDQDQFGAGTKLPHNVTGLIGVMDGHESDLRTGLYRQMIQIHEPMRMLAIVEATEERLLRVLDSLPSASRLVRNGWIRFVAMHPETGEMTLFDGAGFVPHHESEALAIFPTSRTYYQGRRRHLQPVRITSGLGSGAKNV